MIECKNITKNYNSGDIESKILKGISFSIKNGEFVAIIGPSGSGKSTLMHILGMLDTPTSGDYFLDEKNVAKYSDDELAEIRKSKIGFVFQSFNLLPRTTVLRNVCLPLVYAGMKKAEREKRGKEALAHAGLTEQYYNHYTNQLSGGQMQRVAIARALVNNPAMILADEPTGNLDTKTGEIVMETFQELNAKQGHTIVLITHEPDIAGYADRIITVRDGLIVDDRANVNKKIGIAGEATIRDVPSFWRDKNDKK
jgi:putative ABC transport system ATP-binding protein